MHAVDQVFTQQDSDTVQWKEVISEKNLDKGDGGWSQCKQILGWLLDSSCGNPGANASLGETDIGHLQ